MNPNEMQLLKLIPLLQQVLARAGIHRTRTGAGLEITTLQTTALGAVYRKDNLTMSELAKEMLVIQSAATRISDELVKRALVKRVDDKDDRRVTRLRITPKGRSAIENLRSESQYLLSQVLNQMSPADKEDFTRGLQSFMDAVQKVEREYVLQCTKLECAEMREAVQGKNASKSLKEDAASAVIPK
jgi:DNA-binding MarR family transcriptional regulator